MIYLSSSIGFNILASCHHDKTKGRKEGHQSEPFRTTDQIDELGEGKLDYTSHDAGYDRSGTRERKQVERRSDIGGKVILDLLLHRYNEEDQEDTTP